MILKLAIASSQEFLFFLCFFLFSCLFFLFLFYFFSFYFFFFCCLLFFLSFFYSSLFSFFSYALKKIQTGNRMLEESLPFYRLLKHPVFWFTSLFWRQSGRSHFVNYRYTVQHLWNLKKKKALEFLLRYSHPIGIASVLSMHLPT